MFGKCDVSKQGNNIRELEVAKWAGLGNGHTSNVVKMREYVKLKNI